MSFCYYIIAKALRMLWKRVFVSYQRVAICDQQPTASNSASD